MVAPTGTESDHVGEGELAVEREVGRGEWEQLDIGAEWE